METDGELQDRETVTGVGWMLAERAVRHAAGQNSIDVGAARRAAAMSRAQRVARPLMSSATAKSARSERKPAAAILRAAPGWPGTGVFALHGSKLLKNSGGWKKFRLMAAKALCDSGPRLMWRRSGFSLTGRIVVVLTLVAG